MRAVVRIRSHRCQLQRFRGNLYPIKHNVSFVGEGGRAAQGLAHSDTERVQASAAHEPRIS